MRTAPSRSIISVLLFVGTAAVLAQPFTAEAQAGPFQYYAVSPCRIYDTRSGQPSAAGTGGGTLFSATIRSFTIRSYCGVPANASAVSLNLTIVNPTAPGGDLRVAPYPGSFPNVSTTNYYQNETIANGAIVPLGGTSAGGGTFTGPDFQVLGAGCGVISGTFQCLSTFTFDLLIDVTGYFQ